MGTEIGSDKGRLLVTRANLELVCGISNFPFSRFKNREQTLSIGTPFMAHRDILRP